MAKDTAFVVVRWGTEQWTAGATDEIDREDALLLADVVSAAISADSRRQGKGRQILIAVGVAAGFFLSLSVWLAARCWIFIP